MTYVLPLFFFFAVLVIGGSLSGRAARLQNRSARRNRPVRSGMAPRMTSRPIPPGNSPTYRPGDSPTYRPGDSATYAPGDSATYRPGNSATFSPGDSSTYRPGDSPTYRPGNSPTYAPAAPIGSRPVVKAPAPPPGPPPTTGRPRPRRDQGFQPSYATRAERQTELRDQGTLDRDRRSAARTDPTQAPQEGSTAISSSSLNTTLAIPYQPSSLLTSLSSSLSSSLFDTPARTTDSSVFAAVPAVSLSPDVEETVLVLIRDGNEVEAVRVVIDQMNVGILEATKTVRSYGVGRGRR